MITNAAMGTPRRPVKLTGDAPFHSHGDPVYVRVFVQGSPEIVVPIFVRWRCAQL